MNRDAIAKAMVDCFISPNVSDSNGESANLVDVFANVSRNLGRIASALERIAEREASQGVVVSKRPGSSEKKPSLSMPPEDVSNKKVRTRATRTA